MEAVVVVVGETDVVVEPSAVALVSSSDSSIHLLTFSSGV